MQRPPRSNARSRSIAAPKPRESIMRRESGFSALPLSHPTTPSSRNRSTARSPAGIRRRSTCSDIRRRKRSAKASILSFPAITNSSGAISGTSKIARDITDRKRTQQALSRQIEERRRIFETSQDLILVTDPKGVLVQVSPSSASILGYLPEEMIDHSAID